MWIALQHHEIIVQLARLLFTLDSPFLVVP